MTSTAALAALALLLVAANLGLRFMINTRRQDASDDKSVALGLIADIADGSTSAYNLPRIANIARVALGDEIDPDRHDSPCGTGRGRGSSQGAHGAAPPLAPNGCGND